MKYLNGRDLADFVKERQAKQVRALRQAYKVFPRLAIIVTTDNPVINSYVALKQSYGADILIDVDVYTIPQDKAIETITKLNEDESVHGIIVQLPLADNSQADLVLSTVSPYKDVDGLGSRQVFDPATPTAINWLLAGYNINLDVSKIAIVGQGRLVGAPLAAMWRDSGYDVSVFDENNSQNLNLELRSFDIIVTATGVANLIKSSMCKIGAIIVDAGTASEHGKIVGDVSPDVRERDDLTITPEKGGVGPLTIAALFENVIRSATSRSN